MRLDELEPKWIDDKDRKGIGIRFDCPICQRVVLAVQFLNPLDGLPAAPPNDHLLGDNSGKRWARSGMTFADLTLNPSIDASVVLRQYYKSDDAFHQAQKPCNQGGNAHWHGFITHGEIR